MGLPLVTSSRDPPILGPAAAPLYQDQVTMLVGWFTFGNNLTDLGVINPFLTVLDIEVKIWSGLKYHSKATSLRWTLNHLGWITQTISFPLIRVLWPPQELPSIYTTVLTVFTLVNKNCRFHCKLRPYWLKS